MPVSPGRVLRERLATGEILIVPGAFDALTGRLLERAGFEVIYRGGYAASAAAFGLPDLGITSAAEMVDHARRLCSAVSIPVIADADTGYGEVAQVMRTVHELERAGVAAIQLEDQVFPKRCGHMDGKDVIAPELHEQKLRAALAARADPGTLIVARTDAIAVTGLDDAIARAHRYAAAGADVIFIDAPRSEDELRAIGSAGIGKPLLDLGAPAFAALGFAIALYPTSTLFAASQSTTELATALRKHGSTRTIVPRMMPFDELNETLGKDDWDVNP